MMSQKSLDWDSESGGEIVDGTDQEEASEYTCLGGPLLGISTRIPGARRCLVYAHDTRKVDSSRVVRTLCRTLLLPSEERCEELFHASLRKGRREIRLWTAVRVRPGCIVVALHP